MPVDGNVVHTVNFFQGAITIIFALALGEALKMFVTSDEDALLAWNRLPALLAFLFVFVPFFQSVSQYLYLTYLNPKTAPPFHPGYLVFDGIMYVLEAACFFLMSRALSPRNWRHFYVAVIVLMVIDIVWSGVTYLRGIHVGAWIYIDAAIIVLLGGAMAYGRGKGWYGRGAQTPMQPAYLLMVVLGLTTAISYWLESEIYFP